MEVLFFSAGNGQHPFKDGGIPVFFICVVVKIWIAYPKKGMVIQPAKDSVVNDDNNNIYIYIYIYIYIHMYT